MSKTGLKYLRALFNSDEQTQSIVKKLFHIMEDMKPESKLAVGCTQVVEDLLFPKKETKTPAELIDDLKSLLVEEAIADPLPSS